MFVPRRHHLLIVSFATNRGGCASERGESNGTASGRRVFPKTFPRQRLRAEKSADRGPASTESQRTSRYDRDERCSTRNAGKSPWRVRRIGNERTASGERATFGSTAYYLCFLRVRARLYACRSCMHVRQTGSDLFFARDFPFPFSLRVFLLLSFFGILSSILLLQDFPFLPFFETLSTFHRDVHSSTFFQIFPFIFLQCYPFFPPLAISPFYLFPRFPLFVFFPDFPVLPFFEILSSFHRDVHFSAFFKIFPFILLQCYPLFIFPRDFLSFYLSPRFFLLFFAPYNFSFCLRRRHTLSD